MLRHPDAAPKVNGGRPHEARSSIFISYGRENVEAVERLHRAIVALGGDAWFDRTDLSAGDQWEKKILPQIRRDARLFVPVISDGTALRKEGHVRGGARR